MQEENLFEIVVPRNQTRERLDKFLTRFLGQFSRARLQKVIAEGLVLVDGEPAKSSHIVLPAQKIDVCIPKPTKVDILPEKIPIKILYEDEHLLVLNKDTGMVVHPAFANYTGTLVNALLYHCGDLSSIGGRQRPGIVHRLDKETSGIMVVAKNDRAHRDLSAQFKQKSTERLYRAIAWHPFRHKQGRIENTIARSPKDRRRMSVQPDGKLAITHYQVLERFRNHALVQLKLETGRTHQIRVHLSFLGHPVFGDYVYGGRRRQLNALSSRDRQAATTLLEMMPRQALHAKVLGFTHPITNEYMRFESSLPEDMQLLLDCLRSEKA
ncbi:MAG: RluA family pseudouridine synthase [bacterium]